MGQVPETQKRTPLYDLHLEAGAKMVPFAGYEMALQYQGGILAEHRQTREAAGLFDVSHMGQVVVRGDDPAAAIERLVPGDIRALGAGAMRYTQFTDDAGGILDDLMVTNRGAELFVVVNAACKEADLAHLEAGLAGLAEVEALPERALLAMQGPKAAAVLVRHAPAAAELVFMHAATMTVGGIDCLVSRSGYTGEDGFEISTAATRAEDLARLLLAAEEVQPIGLGARDSLRLEAGLCLYGHDIDETTTPVEAALTWSISKRRRQEGGFPGAEVIQRQLRDGTLRKRVGIRPDGRQPAREGAEIVDADGNGIGVVTSGGFGPTIGGPVAMGYVEAAHASVDGEVGLVVRGKTLPGRVAKLPFVPQRYWRG